MSAYAGTWPLVRLALRRDRVLLPAWIGVLVLMSTSSAAATVGVYPTEASRVAAAKVINETPSLVALYGRIYDPTSLGAVSLIKLMAFGSAMVGVLAIITLVRHTRHEEETGRLELVGAAVVGRRAALTAALVVVVGAQVCLGLLAALGLLVSGLPVSGSVAFGLAWAGSGIAFAAVAAVTAQLTTSGRAATGIAMAVLGASYLVRAFGDTASEGGATWLSYGSPIGWAEQLRPFAGNRWALLLATVVFALLMVVIAYVLAQRRDLGAGLLADRPGAAVAGPSLRTPLALAWRLQRGLLLGWALGFVVLGAVVGNIASNVGHLLDNPQAQELIRRLGGQQGLSDAFLAAELGIAAVIASAYGVQSVLRLHAEETSLHAESLLATSVGRIRFALSHLLVALAGTTALLLLAGASAGVASGLASGGVDHQLPRLVGAAVGHLPAVWVVVGLAVLVFGLLPQHAVVAWVPLVGFLLLQVVGPLLRLSHWVLDLSPYAHTPRLPGGPVAALPLVLLGSLAAALTAGGLVAFRRRDLV